MADRVTKKTNSRIRGGTSPDPYLRAFLSQAVAIIAAERGMNDSGFAKLQVVAERLGLSDETFEAAVEKLKLPHSMLGLNRYEKRFVERLSKEFEQMRGDVLSIKAEDRIVELAENRYQIDSVRAYQLIRNTAEQHDVATISHVDAQQYAMHLIDEAAGNNTWLRQNEQQRLHQACVKWGLSDSAVDSAIGVRLARNRRLRRRKILRVWAITVVVLVIAASLFWAGTQLNWQRLAGYLSEAPKAIVSSRIEPGPPIPTWWDEQTVSTANFIQQRNRSLAPLIIEIYGADTEGRQSVYERMTSQLLDASEWDPVLAELMATFYVRDPADKSVSTIIGQLETLFAVSKSDNVATPSQIRKSLAANRLLAELFEFIQNQDVSSKRRTNVNELIERVFNSPPTAGSIDEFASQTGLRLTVDQWIHAARHSRTKPQQVAAFVPELGKRLDGRDDPGINELRTHVLLNILSAQPYQWRTLQTTITTAINNSNDTTTISWIDLLSTTTERSLNEFLENQLAAHLNLKTDGQSREAILSELWDFRLQIKHRSISAALAGDRKITDRIQQLEKRLNDTGIGGLNTEISALNQDQLPELIVEAARINNVGFAWIQAVESAHNFSDFDELESRSLPLATESDKQLQPIAKPVATYSENRTFQQNLDRLFNSEPDQITARISALQSLAKLAEKYDDINYPTAEKLVSWLFEGKETREQLAVERALPQFSHWTQMQLAIADGIDHPEWNLDAVLSHLNRLGFPNLTVDRDGDWRDGLRKEILLAVSNRNSHELETVENRAAWNHLEMILRDQYAQRIRLIDVNDDPVADLSLSDMLCFGIESSLFELEQLQKIRWLRSLELIRSTDADEFSKLVLANQILAEVYRSRSSGSQPTGLLSSKYASDIRSNTLNNGQRLLASELMLLEVLADYREHWIGQVTE